jgi:uncharacterized integral membrane protein
VRFRRRPSTDSDTDTGEPHEDTWQPRLYLRLLALLLLAAYAIAFVLKNRTSVNIDFVFADANVSLIWLILLSLGIAFVIGVLLSQLYRRRRRLRSR